MQRCNSNNVEEKFLSYLSLPFQHCTFAPCKFSQSQRPGKSKTLHRIEVLLSTFPLVPSKQCCSDHAQMSNWDCQHCVVGARGSDYELQLNIFYLAINMLVNGSDKHILLSNSNSSRSYLTMYKLLTRPISFRTKKPKKSQKRTLFKEVVLCV